MTNVRSIFDKKKQQEPEVVVQPQEPDVPPYDFEADMERNKKLAERKAKERLQANKGVLRSYRIKN